MSRTPYAAIREGYEQIGIDMPSQSWRQYVRSEIAELTRCSRCGLDYFDGAIPGDGSFYEQLMRSPTYYSTGTKWDFERARRYIPLNKRLLDVGCGPGTFLETVRDLTPQLFGIDTNQASVAVATSKGISALCAPLDEFVTVSTASFDVTCLFQVVEHVPDALAFTRAAAESLDAGGKLIVTVPMRSRRFATGLEPLDFPPHHVSRWAPPQLRYLARALDLDLVALEYETSAIADCANYVARRTSAPAGQALPWPLGGLAYRMAYRAAATAFSLLDTFGALPRLGFVQHSIMAVMAKRGPHA